MKPARRGRKSWVGAGLALTASASMVVALGVSDATAVSAARADMSATPGAGAVVTMAEGPLGTPDYIMPFVTGAGNVLANVDLQYQMWPTLY
ncbi:MAG: hypothetical protein ACRDV4_03895, partial [Acidimicrobiales bacterium]